MPCQQTDTELYVDTEPSVECGLKHSACDGTERGVLVNIGGRLIGELSSIVVSPASFSIAAAATQQLQAVIKDAAGNEFNITDIATWTSSNEAAATVSSSGLVTGVAAGTATITAAYIGIQGTSAATIT